MLPIRYRCAWSTHMPMLMAVVERTDGPILEIGTGIFSTPYLHWHCFREKRTLVSYENSEKFYDGQLQFAADFHTINFVKNWDEAKIESPWAVALIDHGPEDRRKVEIARLASHAEYIVAHDSERVWRRKYRYDEVYPLFKYRYHFIDVKPNTVVLSNFHDLEWLTRQ